MTRIMLPSLSAAAKASVKADAQHRLTIVALAMQRYRLAHGEFPKDLGALVPEYLVGVPADPFTGRPLKMAAPGGGLVVYCVGKDLKDDGGDPIDKETGKGDVRFVLKLPATTQPTSQPTTQPMQP